MGNSKVHKATVENGGHLPTTQAKLPSELRSYIREVESKSGLSVHPRQRELLAADLRQNTYSKLEADAYAAHQKPFQNKTLKDRLITEWEHMGGTVEVRKWPKHPDNLKTKSGKPHPQAGQNYHAHHINPQELGGKHEWWNMHPTHIHDHIGKGGVHSGVINQIVTEVSKK